MLKKILVRILIFLLLIGGFVVYINKVLIPEKIKNLLIQNLENFTQRKIQIEDLSYDILKGFVIKNIVIFDNPSYGNRVFLKASEVSFNLFWLPIFKERKIIIPGLKIDSLEFNVTRNQDLWNFSDIFAQKPKLAPSKNKTSFFIYKIDIIDAKGNFEDKSFAQVFLRQITDLDIKLYLSLPTKIKTILSAKVKNQSDSSIISMKAEFDIRQKILNSKLSITNFPYLEYNLYFENLPFEIKNGIIDTLSLNLQFKKDTYFNLIYNLHTNNLSVINKVGPFKGLSFSGSFSLNGNFDDKFKEKLITYQGKIIASNISLGGLFKYKTDNITGLINFNQNQFSTENLQFSLEGIPLFLKGILRNYRTIPYVDIKLNSDFDLANIKNILKERFQMEVQTQGKINLQMYGKGYLGQKDSPEIQGKALLSDGLIKFPQFDEIQKLHGPIEFDRKKINLQNLQGQYHNQDFKLSALITNIPTPFVEADFSSNKLSFKTKFNLEKNNLFVSYLEGNYLNFNYNLEGRANLDTANNPELLVKGLIKFNLNDLKTLLPQINFLEKLKPEGNCALNISMNGRLKPWQNWTLSVATTMPTVSFYGFKSDNFSLDYKQITGIVQNFKILAHPYQGLLQVSGEADLDKKNYVLNIDLSGLKLEKLKLDTPLKEKDISGTLNSTAIILGRAKDLNSITGKIIFTVQDGNLWEVNFLKGLGRFLSLSGFEKIIFKEAYGEFLISNKYFYTNNSYLKSDEMNLSLQGAIGFDSSINFEITTQINPNLTVLVEERNVFGQILGQLSRATVIRLTGTLKEPKYSVLPLGTDFLKNIKDLFRGSSK